jgi:hypothetical protein
MHPSASYSRSRVRSWLESWPPAPKAFGLRNRRLGVRVPPGAISQENVVSLLNPVQSENRGFPTRVSPGFSLILVPAVVSESGFRSRWPLRVVGPSCDPLFSLLENAIAEEPWLSYPERWRCVVLTRYFNGGSDSLESSPSVTLSRGGFSASSLVTPIPWLHPGIVWFPFATVTL